MYADNSIVGDADRQTQAALCDKIGRNFQRELGCETMTRAFTKLSLATGLMLLANAPVVSGWQQSKKAAPAQSQGMTVDGVINLIQNGISEDVILTRLHKANVPMELTDDDLIKLKKANVSDNIVKTMIDPAAEVTAPAAPADAVPSPAPVPVAPAAPQAAPAAAEPARNAPATAPAAGTEAADDPDSPHDPGIYLFAKDAQGKPHMRLLDRGAVHYQHPWKSFQQININAKAVFDGPHATIRCTDPNPVFYISWENTGAAVPFDQSVVTPNQFKLVQLTVSNKSRREVGLAIHNEISRKEVLRVAIEKLGSRIFYKVTLRDALLPGEYAFMSSVALSNDVFDFGVDPAPAQ